MDLRPISECAKPSPKLTGRMSLVTGRDSGIGRTVTYAFVKECAKVAIAYYDEEQDAQETAGQIRELGGDCLLLRGDLKNPAFAKHCVAGRLNRNSAASINHYGIMVCGLKFTRFSHFRGNA